ncbi:hypothetical protein BT96DRAFT_912809 [Gymnopus androsaceus JB14]|uniref:Uncharacterized protein n=1 Tax=Gymnopus androsaceus JB14 TaxID=1447944 RepID=A0A6A4IN68_9AGAR|nr:hypothetical protein BT96DRAFT_912809 [Gymnopus androsaceus JB14]
MASRCNGNAGEEASSSNAIFFSVIIILHFNISRVSRLSILFFSAILILYSSPFSTVMACRSDCCSAIGRIQ